MDAVLTSLSNEEDEKAILDGEFTFVFCNPESIIRNAKWREMVSFEIYKTNFLAFVLTNKVHVGLKGVFNIFKYRFF